MDPPAAAAPTPALPVAPVHDAFISYSRRDRDFAALLEKALKAYKPPPGLGLAARFLNVFRDESDFSGTEYYAAIDAQLRQSRKLILLCSPAARGSGFVDDEVRRFIQIRGAENVIALLLAGLPNNEAGPGREQDMAFPQALCEALRMPLATSFVGFDPKANKLGKDSFEAAWYMVLANLYDVSRKEIEERDRKRQARQRRNAWAAALAVILMLSGALVFALISRQQAVEQRQVALAEKTEAQRQRDIAEERRRAALARQLNVAADAALADGAEGVRRSLLLGIESMRTHWTVEAHQALLAHIDLLPRPPLAKRQAHQAAVLALAISRGGEWIASESEDGTVVWDRVAQREITRLPPTGAQRQRRALAFSPDRRWLVASCQQAAGCVWDTGSWTIAAPLQEDAMLQAAAFSPDGKLLASVVRGSVEVQLRDTQTWRLRPGLGGGAAAKPLVRGLAFSPDGRWLATQHPERVVVWDIASRRQVAQFESADSVAQTLAFSPDGRHLVVNGNQGMLLLVALKTDAAGGVRLVAEPNWRSARINPRVTPVFSPDGARLAVGLAEGSVAVMSVADPHQITHVARAAGALVFDPERAELVAGNPDGSVAAWELGALEFARLPHPGPASRLALSADGQWLAALDAQRAVRVIDSASRRQVAQFEAAEAGTTLDFSRDGRWLLQTSAHAVTVVDTRNWTEVLRHRGDDWITGQVMLTPDGGWLLVAAGSHVHRFATGDWRKAPAIEVQARNYFVSPDGQRLATHSEWSFARGLGLLHPSMTRVWDQASGAPLAWLSHEAEDFQQTEVFGRRGRAPNATGPWTTATAGGDVALANAALQWPRLNTLADLRTTPDAVWLASRNARGEALADTHLERARRAHGVAAITSAFSADGGWLASAGSDATLRLWRLPTAELTAEACARIARNLTPEEWKLHLGDDPYQRTCPDAPPP